MKTPAGIVRNMHFRIICTAFAIFCIGALGWTGAWSLCGLLLPGLPPLSRGLVSFALAFAGMILSGMLWGRFLRHRRPDVFGQFNEALRRIAQGDYKVQVPLSDANEGGPVAEFNALAQNLNSMAGSLARMEELRRQFVADVSHEFQSPLTSILGFAAALKPRELPENLRLRYLGIIETEARRLSKVSVNLLRLNALDDRDSPPDPAPFRLDAQLRSVLVALEPQWSAKGLQIEAELSPVEALGNEELWTQVWMNAIGNAVKFTPPGGSVTVRLAEGPPTVVEIIDSGIGLAPGEAERVFERFYKAESARTYIEGGSGSGLGLALAKRIAALHGADIEASSKGLGSGTTLRVTFPR